MIAFLAAQNFSRWIPSDAPKSIRAPVGLPLPHSESPAPHTGAPASQAAPTSPAAAAYFPTVRTAPACHAASPTPPPLPPSTAADRTRAPRGKSVHRPPPCHPTADLAEYSLDELRAATDRFTTEHIVSEHSAASPSTRPPTSPTTDLTSSGRPPTDSPLSTSPTDLIDLVAITEQELKQVEMSFNEATHKCISLMKPDRYLCKFGEIPNIAYVPILLFLWKLPVCSCTVCTFTSAN